MAKRGRKSNLEKEVELNVVSINPLTKPEPPEGLTDQEAALWRAVVDDEPVDLFQSEAIKQILLAFIQHCITAWKITSVLNEFDIEWIKNEEGAKRFDKLIQMRREETAAIKRMATALRITNQARYTPKAAAAAGRNEKKSAVLPWEFE